MPAASSSSSSSSSSKKKTPLYRVLYVQVLFAVVVGVLLGHFAPDVATTLKPLGDGFIKLIKMIIAPVIFLTVVSGIASMTNLEKAGRVGGKAMLWFLCFSTLALAVGLVVANVLAPGAGMHIDPTTLDPHAITSYAEKAKEQSLTAFVLNVIPTTAVGAFTSGEILQVLLLAVLCGIALSSLGERGAPLVLLVQRAVEVVFVVVGIIMKLAPIGAFGAMAFTIGSYGVGALKNLLSLIVVFYLAAGCFVVVVLGTVARLCGFSIFKLLRFISSELLIVLGTSSSESAMPSLMKKLVHAGCSPGVVGLVVPMGYSFNLDGTNIYMTMAALFIAQATDTPLTLSQQLLLLGVAMISSKGAAGVTGSGFVTLAATLSVVPAVPVVGMGLILGIDRFMSECRALTNIIGNAVATIGVARWEGELDRDRLAAVLDGRLVD
ncbi:MAG TPA: dicarboxylate/amino acid:cation symporter [Myxococcota bacterium]